jgi:hypothetical protein
MRKLLPFFLIICLDFTYSFAQDGLLEFSKSYFRSDPLNGEFSNFLNHLMNDPSLQDKKNLKRTDTSLFYFSGTYKKYDRFFFKPKRVEVTLREQSVKYIDSLPPDTIFIYQLIAYADGNSNGEQDVKKEFEKIHRMFNKKFHSSNYQDLESEGVKSGALHNYFVSYSALAPVTTVWGKLENEFVLQIDLRIKASSNRAVLAASLYNSQ